MKDSMLNVCKENVMLLDNGHDGINLSNHIIAPFISMLGYDPFQQGTLLFNADSVVLNINPETSIHFALNDDFTLEPGENSVRVLVTYSHCGFRFTEAGKDIPFLSFNILSDDISSVEVILKESFSNGVLKTMMDSVIISSNIMAAINTAFESPSEELIKVLFPHVVTLPDDISVLVTEVFNSISEPLAKASISEERPGVVADDESDEDDNSKEELVFADVISFVAHHFGKEVADKMIIRHGKAYSSIMFENNRKGVMRLHFGKNKNSIGLLVDSKEQRVYIDAVDETILSQPPVPEVLITEMIKFGCSELTTDVWVPVPHAEVTMEETTEEYLTEDDSVVDESLNTEDDIIDDNSTSQEKDGATEDADPVVENTVTDEEAASEDATVQETESDTSMTTDEPNIDVETSTGDSSDPFSDNGEDDIPF